MADINVTRSSLPDFEEYCEEIRGLWDSHWLTNMGAKHQAFEEALCTRCDAADVALFANGHLALEAALSAVIGDAAASESGEPYEVITTPFTFASTTHAIARCGFKPVFADVRADDLTIDPASVEALITDRTVAIVPVHVYGTICDTAALADIADRYGLRLIYDAAHAFGERVGGVSVASFGDASMFSFHATKVFHTIEGGAVFFRDPALKVRLNALKNFGMDATGEVVCVGGNAKMNEFCAAMGLCNLRHLDEEIAKRKAVYERYADGLRDIPGLRVWQPQEGVEPNYAYLPVIVEDGFPATRDGLAERLAEQGYGTRAYFYPLTCDFPCYADDSAADVPNARWAAERVLCLPMYADLPLSAVDEICEIVATL